jgi:hypothetical protein
MALIVLLALGSVTLAADPPASQPTTQFSDKAAERSKALKADPESFWLQLSYNGGSDKPFYQVRMQVAKVQEKRSRPFSSTVQITEKQAAALVDYFAAAHLLDDAHDIRAKEIELGGPAYILYFGGKGSEYAASLGWNLQTLDHLTAMSQLVDGDASKAMEELIGRISGYREQWKAAAQKKE